MKTSLLKKLHHFDNSANVVCNQKKWYFAHQNMQNDTHTMKIRFVLEEIKDQYLSDNRPWIVGFSGGKDSTMLLQLIWIALRELPLDKGCNSNCRTPSLSCGFPENIGDEIEFLAA